jgi:hypothetical protein
VFAREFRPRSDVTVTVVRARRHESLIPVNVTYEEVERGGRRRVSAPCTRCAGTGNGQTPASERCSPCDGSGRAHGAELVYVKIPRGVADGEELPAEMSDGARFVARIVDDARWARDGADIHVTRYMPYELAVLGGTLSVDLPGRTYRVEVEPGTPSGHRSRIPRQGLPSRDRGPRGDLILTLHIAVPERVGFVERWLLESRRLGSGRGRVRGVAMHLCRTQARAWTAARDEWSRWRDRHQRSALRRAEDAAASLRAAAGLVSDFVRMRPLIEEGFRIIVPAAERAHSRLQEHTARPRLSALAALVVDGTVVVIVAGFGWLGARYASPALAVAAAGEAPWWQFLDALHPAAFPMVPAVAGLAAGAVLARTPQLWIRLVVGLPLGLAVAGAAVAAGSASYAVSLLMIGGTESVAASFLSRVLAVVVSIIPVILFLLCAMLVKSARIAIAQVEDYRDRRILRKYDAAAAGLAGDLWAFRQLVAQARDVGPPLAALVDQTAGTLAGHAEGGRPSGPDALLALLFPVLITALWIAAISLAVGAVFTVLPAETPLWVRVPTAATIAALCSLGSLVPSAVLEQHRPNRIVIPIACAVAALVLAAILGGVGGAEPGPGWLLAGGAVAALVLSFRLIESMAATRTAAVMILAAAVAMILWPVVAVVSALGPRGRSAEEEPAVPRF